MIPSIVIPNSVSYIGSFAFSGCSNLKSITLPENLIRIYRAAFEGCNSLTNIDVSDNNENYSSIDGVLFHKDQTILIKHPAGKKEFVYIIPNTVTSIVARAFKDCINIDILIIPESITGISTECVPTLPIDWSQVDVYTIYYTVSYVFSGWQSHQTIYIIGKIQYIGMSIGSLVVMLELFGMNKIILE